MEKPRMAEYACADFSAEQLKEIRLGIEDGVAVELYADTKFNAEQMKEMRLVLSSDPLVYNNIAYCLEHKSTGKLLSADMMRRIRIDMQYNEVDVKDYADPNFDSEQMREIRLGLYNVGKEFKKYISRDLDNEQLRQIRLGLENGVDVELYADPEFDSEQMKQIRIGLMLN